LESRLDRIDGDQLQRDFFGDVEFHLARDKTQIELQVSRGRIGLGIVSMANLPGGFDPGPGQISGQSFFYTEK